jgi:predicted transcriptional regulator
MAAKMVTMGMSLDPDEMDRMRILMRMDRRSLSWLVREAVQFYLRARAQDIAKYTEQFKAEQTSQPVTSANSTAVGPPNEQENKGLTEGKE